MRIATYLSQDAPAGHEACAHYFDGGSLHPVVVFARTEEAAREKAERWLAAEIERARPKAPKTKRTPVPTTTDLEDIF
jgi:hypothetical protein